MCGIKREFGLKKNGKQIFFDFIIFRALEMVSSQNTDLREYIIGVWYSPRGGGTCCRGIERRSLRDRRGERGLRPAPGCRRRARRWRWPAGPRTGACPRCSKRPRPAQSDRPTVGTHAHDNASERDCDKSKTITTLTAENDTLRRHLERGAQKLITRSSTLEWANHNNFSCQQFDC